MCRRNCSSVVWAWEMSSGSVAVSGMALALRGDDKVDGSIVLLLTAWDKVHFLLENDGPEWQNICVPAKRGAYPPRSPRSSRAKVAQPTRPARLFRRHRPMGRRFKQALILFAALCVFSPSMAGSLP